MVGKIEISKDLFVNSKHRFIQGKKKTSSLITVINNKKLAKKTARLQKSTMEKHYPSGLFPLLRVCEEY